MQKRLIFILTLVLALSLQVFAQQSATLIVGGQGAGPFKIGSPFAEVTKRLGAPDSSKPTAGDPRTTVKMYESKQLAFLVNPESKIIGITVARKDWKTAQGLGVGSPVIAFQESYGKGLKRGSGHTSFAEDGLAITHRGGIVKTVYVVKKDKLDASKGDYLLIGGTRAGQLRLGSSEQDLLKLLGKPPKKEGRGQSIWVYPDQGIRLGVIQGRLHLVGVTSGDWVTPSGLKVGRTFSEMKRELGAKYRVESSSVFYDQWGIGARLLGEQIVELLIFNPKTSNRQG